MRGKAEIAEFADQTLDDFDGHGVAEHSSAMSEHIWSELVLGRSSTTNVEVRTEAQSGRREIFERGAP